MIYLFICSFFCCDRNWGLVFLVWWLRTIQVNHRTMENWCRGKDQLLCLRRRTIAQLRVMLMSHLLHFLEIRGLQFWIYHFLIYSSFFLFILLFFYEINNIFVDVNIFRDIDYPEKLLMAWSYEILIYFFLLLL
jgi:hypothetical protein